MAVSSHKGELLPDRQAIQFLFLNIAVVHSLRFHSNHKVMGRSQMKGHGQRRS